LKRLKELKKEGMSLPENRIFLVRASLSLICSNLLFPAAVFILLQKLGGLLRNYLSPIEPSENM